MWCRHRAWRQRRPTRAVRAAPVSPNTSPRAPCSGSAGQPWSPGYLARANNLGNAITLGHLGQDYYGLVIGIGGWLGTIMAFNVWVFIWPNQKKILGIVPATDEEKAKARKTAAMASRINFVLSIPLLLCMGASNHPLPF